MLVPVNLDIARFMNDLKIFYGIVNNVGEREVQ